MKKPKPSASKVQATRVSKPVGVPISIVVPKKLYVHIKDPDDRESLLQLKKICSDYLGESEIVLVLGADKKSAIKLPFRVEINDNLVGKLVKILGEDCVKLK